MTPESTVTPETAPSNFFSRLIGVYFSPGETFAEIGRHPSFVVPLLVLMLVGGLGAYMLIERVTVPKFFGQGLEQAVTKEQITQEQANKQLEAMTSRTPIIKGGFFISGLVQWAIIPLIVAGLFKLISMVMGKDNEFKPLFTVTVYAMLAIALLSSLVFITTLYLKPVDEIDLQSLGTTNLGALLAMVVGKDGLPKFITALARWIDLFAIWMIALLSIGYAAVTRKLKTSTAAFALGGLYVGVALIAATIAAIRG